MRNRIFRPRILFFFLLIAFWGYSAVWAMAQRRPEFPTKTKQAQDLPPLSLRDCYELTLKQSETLAVRNVQIEKTWSDFLAATGEMIGTGDFMITQLKQDSSKGLSSSSVTAPTLRERSFAFSQPLFQGFKAIAGLKGAGSLRNQRISERNRALQTLFMDVVTAFYSVLQTQRDIEITQAIMNLLNERIGELKDREKIGRSRESEVVDAESKVKPVEAEIARLRGVYQYDLRILEFLTGISLENREFTDTYKLVQVSGELKDYLPLAQNRPDVLAAKYAVQTALQGIIVAQSDLWPQISLDNNVYEHREGVQSGIDWDLLFTIDIPLYKGGATAGKIKAAYSDWKEYKFKYRHTLRMAELAIKQSYDNWQSNLEQFRDLRKAVEIAHKNYDLQQADYSRNLVNNLDVLTAMESLYNNKRNENRAYYDLKRDYWYLQVATGACCESI